MVIFKDLSSSSQKNTAKQTKLISRLINSTLADNKRLWHPLAMRNQKEAAATLLFTILIVMKISIFSSKK